MARIAGDEALCRICSDKIQWNEGGQPTSITDFNTCLEEVERNIDCRLCKLIRHVIPASLSSHRLKIQGREVEIGDQSFIAYVRMDDLSTGDENLLGYIIRLPDGSQDAVPTLGPHHLNIDPQTKTLDTAKVQGYLALCQAKGCFHLPADMPRYRNPINVVLIDVAEMRLTARSTRDRYLTLSYVWGGVAGLQLNMGTKNRLKQSNSLETYKAQIPAVINDAIRMVKSLDERYLWVDQLCIEQDNAEDKHDQIKQMDIIYRSSLLCIVALGSKNAGHPLPGIRAGTIQPALSQSERIGPSTVMSEVSKSAEYSNSRYATRAWTFQEHLLAPRLLHMTGSSADYICDLNHNEQPINATGGVLTYKLRFLLIEEQDLDPWSTYRDLVKHYTCRLLSHDSDKLNAFIGLYAIINHRVLGEHLSGLSTKKFGLALLWTPVNGVSVRRNPLFPSWSWAGWIGRVEYDMSRFQLEPLFSDLLIQARLSRESKGSNNASIPPKVTRNEKVGGVDTILLDGYFIAANALNLRGLDNLVLLYDYQDIIGRLYVLEQDLRTSRARLFESEKLPCTEELVYMKSTFWRREAVMVMLIGCPSTGVAERLALGLMYKDVWDKLQPTKKSVILG